MKKEFIINFAILFLVNILIKPAWLLSDLWVQRNTDEAYGAYFVIFNLSMLFNILLDAGINNYNNRKIGALEQRVNNYFGRILGIKSWLSLAYLGILIPFGIFLNINLKCLFVLAFNQILLSFILFFRSNLTGLKHFKLDSLISVLDRVIMLFGIIAYITIYHTINIPAFILIQTFGYMVVFALSLFLTRRKIETSTIKYDWRFSKRVLLKSYPYAIIVLIMAGYSYSDSIMMKMIRDDSDYQNMIYAQSFRIIGAINNYAYLIAVILIPMFSKMIQQKKSLHELLRIAGSVLLMGLISFALFANSYSNALISMLYGESETLNWWQRSIERTPLVNTAEIDFSAEVFSWLIFAIIPMGFNYIYGALLTAAGEIKTLNYIALGGLLLNIFFNAFLIPDYGAEGAAWASVITQYFAGTLQLLFCYRIMKLSFNWLHTLKFGLIILLVVLFNSFFSNHWSWFQSLIVVALISILGLFSLKIVKLQDIQKLFLRKSSQA